MIIPFDPSTPPIVIDGWVTGPGRTAKVLLAIDTGAAGTVLGASFLDAPGVAAPTNPRRRKLRGVTGSAVAPVVTVRQLVAFGQVRRDFPVAAHDLPLGVAYDGLLGLDFFRGLVLTLDFARGRISLNPPRPWWRVWG